MVLTKRVKDFLWRLQRDESSANDEGRAENRNPGTAVL